MVCPTGSNLAFLHIAEPSRGVRLGRGRATNEKMGGCVSHPSGKHGANHQLLLAAAEGNLKAVRRSLARGADINTQGMQVEYLRASPPDRDARTMLTSAWLL